MTSIDVSIVSWNSAAALTLLLQDLAAQTLQPARVIVVDNGSHDASVQSAEAAGATVVRLGDNTGFAHGHNVGIRHGSSPYVLVINPDVRLSPTYLETLVAFAEQHEHSGAFTGVVRRPNGDVDTSGLQVHRTRLVRDRRDAPAHPQKVFGVSGAVALYRRDALQAVAVNDQYFDEQLFAYKEDVQLAWRLQWGGWEAYCVPAAIATHVRSVRVDEPRSARDAQRRFLSYRNHLLLYATAETAGTFWPDAWAAISAELLRLLYLLCTDGPVTLRALAAARKMWHAARTFAAHQPRRARAAQVRAAMNV